MPTALSIRADVLAEKGDAVRAFLSAFARAEEAINALEGNTQAYRAFAQVMCMDQDAPVETLVFGGFAAVPTFAPASVPSEENVAHIQEWAIGAGLLERTFSYEELVDGSFLMDDMADDMAGEDEEADE